ncbi:MAG TPA: twin-arginine translocation signal domain-containing protein [Bacteroidota bacterium]
MIDPLHVTGRRSFLGTLAAGATAMGLSGLALGNEAHATTATLNAPSDASFDAWLKKIKGKHRQVFDAPEVHEGFPLAWPRVFLMTNKQVGVADNDMTAVVVLRHSAIPIAMNDGLWAKYKFGEVFKVEDPKTKASSTRNFYRLWEDFMLPECGVEALQKSGVLLGVCDMALTVYSSNVAKEMNIDPTECKKEWVAGLLPGIQIVPSGVLAVNRAQEHGCTYCFAGGA